MGIAYQLQENWVAASQAYTEVVAIGQQSENAIINIAASIGFGAAQEAQNKLHLAEQTYQRVLQLIGDVTSPSASHVHIGLARICYGRGALDAAGAEALLAEAEQSVQEYGLTHRLGEITAVRQAKQKVYPTPALADALIEPLSERELEILQLIAQGLSNREIGERLFLALSTVKGHNRCTFGKLQVQRRTEAVARARELRLIA